MSTKQKYKNTKVSSNNKQSKNRVENVNVINMIPIIFFIAIIPFIIHMKTFTTPLAKYTWYSEDSNSVDFFLYYKQIFIITISVIMVAIIAFRAYNKKHILKYSKIFIPLAIYAFLALLSSVFSKYGDSSFTGTFSQFESIFVQLGYCLIVYYVYLFVNSEEDIRFILKCFIISILIMGIIGLTQIMGHDFFATELGKRLITPKTYWSNLDSMSFRFPKNWVFLTLYNPNYSGVYTAMVLPFLFILTIFNKKKNLLPLYLLIIVLMIVSLFGSHSIGSVFSIAIATVLLLILLWRYLIKYKFISIPSIILVFVSVVLFNGLNHNIIINKVNSALHIQKVESNLTDIQTNNDNLTIIYKGNTLKAQFLLDANNSCSFVLKDGSDKDIKYIVDNTNGVSYKIEDSRFPGFSFTPCNVKNILSFNVQIDNQNWYFTNQTSDHTYYYFNYYQRLDKIVKAPSAVFTGYENIATNRGYIWSRTIPLIKKNLLLGSGSDSFVYVFPHNDYVNANNFSFGNQLVTRPHSLYLQIAIQSGLISLIAFLLFYGIYFVSSLRLYIKGRFTNFYSQVGAGIMLGTFSYMIGGIANDSCNSIAPVFWTLLGLGIVANIKAKQAFEQEKLIEQNIVS